MKKTGKFLQLLTVDTDLAWRIFLDQYSKIILRYIRARIRQYDDVMQVYISICEKLSANNYRVMKQFQGRRKSKLSTWLTAVVRSHCADWYRIRMGRKRYFRRLQQMDLFHRLAYRHYYWQNMSFSEIAEHLKMTSAIESIRDSDISKLLASVNQEIGSQNIWRSTVSDRAGINHPVRFDEQILLHGRDGGDTGPRSISSAERKYLLQETTVIFENVLSFLDKEEKQMLRLFFWENKTAKKIAGILKLDNEFVAYQRRDGILKGIKKSLEKLGLRFTDFSGILNKINIRIH